MSRLRIATVVGTRPEIIRLSRVIARLDRDFDHVLIHTGQNYDYELNEIFFQDLELRRPDHFLSAAIGTAAETIGNIVGLSDKILAQCQPDALLVLGDTNSALAAIAAKRRRIPIFHMEAGNRCFDFRVPEEINRRIVDHIADINLPYSKIAREYLLREGLPPDQIIVTGSPMREVLNYYLSRIRESNVLNRLLLTPSNYFVLSCHREETVDSPPTLRRLFLAMEKVVQEFDLPIIVSTHPRTKKQLESSGITVDERIQFHKPFGFLDYVQLQLQARAVMSDSGTISEESSILNFPAINLREVHERPEAFEAAAVMLVGANPERICQALRMEMSGRTQSTRARDVVDYMPDNVSDKIARVILSHVDFVNQRTWKKDLM